jgi:hypothetical protein
VFPRGKHSIEFASVVQHMFGVQHSQLELSYGGILDDGDEMVDLISLL